MTYLIPTLDHAVVNLRDRIDRGAEIYRRLGFFLTPRGYHTLGSMNHLAMFGSDSLELIAVPSGDSSRPEISAAPEGLQGLVFATEDADATHAAMLRAGVPVLPPNDFSRPVVVPEGTSDAAFRTVRLKPEAVPDGRVYFCQHLTRGLVWRDEWRHHANGATGIARALIGARDPAVFGTLFGRMFGTGAVRPVAGGCSLTVGLSRFDVLAPDALAAEFGIAADGRGVFMAGLEFRTRSLDQAWQAMETGQIAGARRDANRVVVPPASACGAVLAFCL